MSEDDAIVVGAWGRPSFSHREDGVARPVPGAASAAASYYTYRSGLPMHGRFEACDRGTRVFAAWPQTTT